MKDIFSADEGMVFVDTSFFVEFFKGSKEAGVVYEDFLLNGLVCSSLNVLEETTYVLVKRLGLDRSVSVWDLADDESVFGECLDIVVDFYDSLMSDLDVSFLSMDFSWDKVLDVCRKYRLLPNDGLIATICMSHGISKIASFDEDFRRVDFLEIVEP